MSDYYAAYSRIGEPVIVGKCESYSQAMRLLATRLGAGLDMGTPTILVDLGTIATGDETGFKKLINDDPVFAYIFHLGVHVGGFGDTTGGDE
jgi:hypothetical protein